MTNIDNQELEELRDAYKKLQALEAGGVDNWEGYDIALQEYCKEKNRKKKIRKLFDEVAYTLSEGIYEPSERGAGYGFREESMDEAMGLLVKAFEDGL